MLSKAFRVVLLSSIAASSFAAPVQRWKREVPQEHSHEATIRAVRALLNLNNPDGIVDSVFGLLGNAAASQGLGKLTDPDCLQTATADRAFTNAKAAGDVEGQTQALIYRALERNTGAVGQASVACTSFTPVNPEIAALAQHQDPASDGAAAINKAITLELAKQIKSIGGDPLAAIQSGTFAPGEIGDPTAKGNTCDDENDAAGCIISQNLLVPDATEEEILAAVGGDNGAAETSTASETATPTETSSDVEETGTASETATSTTAKATETARNGNGGGKGNGGKGRGGKGKNRGGNRGNGKGRNRGNGRNRGGNKGGKGGNKGGNNGGNNGNDGNASDTNTATGTATTPAETNTETPTATVSESAPEASQTAAAVGENLQTFTGALGDITAPEVITGGKGFQTNGAEFLNIGAALGRSCDVQHNQCANAANGGADFTVGDCDQQNKECRATIP